MSKRCLEPGKKRGDLVSPATVNKELRHIKAVLGIAYEWEYLPMMSKVTMLKEPYKVPTYVTPEHFAAMYETADAARMPKNLPYPSADWWRALVAFNYMTGWRVSEPLLLRREDLDLDDGYAITRHDDNKGNRDERVPLTGVVIEHLRAIASFDVMVFPWPHCRVSLWNEFHRIQRAAGIYLPCRADPEHTPSCHMYGFHDLRRAFATLNAPTLSADALQSLMWHKCFTTTQRCINMAGQLTWAVDNLYVPDVLKRKA